MGISVNSHPGDAEIGCQRMEALCVWLRNNADLPDDAFTRADRAAHASGERIDIVLTKLGLVDEDTMLRAYSETFELAIMTAEDCPSEPVLEDTLKAIFLRNAQLLPLTVQDQTLHIAVVDPLDQFSIKSVAAKTGFEIEPMLVSQSDFAKAFERLYGRNGTETEGAAGIASVSDELAITDIENLRDQASDAPVIRLVDRMISQAVDNNASDIHISVERNGLRVRQRVDGHLQDIDAPSSSLRSAIISRLKIMANLDIAEQRLPQDGRIRAVIKGREIDLRLATMPHLHGEGAVLRVLDRSELALDFITLGFTSNQISEIDTVLGNSSGIFLVTGPTGSGKTTTLYAALNKLAAPERNIISIEDPVEYQMHGVNQVQVQPKIGLNFAHALRAILRQDPDIVMVGEIRDGETAAIANQAALTGHLVLATLHTNSAASAITRLINMGVDDYLLASTLRGVLSQRLVRRLCQKCKKRARMTRSQKEALSQWLGAPIDTLPNDIPTPTGCDACHGNGYVGRMIVGEMLVVSEAVRTQLLKSPDANEIQHAAETDGLISIVKDGWQKVVSGLTSLDEVMRVTQLQ